MRLLQRLAFRRRSEMIPAVGLDQEHESTFDLHIVAEGAWPLNPPKVWNRVEFPRSEISKPRYLLQLTVLLDQTPPVKRK